MSAGERDAGAATTGMQAVLGTPLDPPGRRQVGIFAKIAIPLLLIVGGSVGHSGYQIYRSSDQSHRTEVAERLQLVAKLVASSVNPADVEALQAPGDFRLPAHERVMGALRAAGDETEIAWVGILRESDGDISMVADIGETGIGYPFFYATVEHRAAFRTGRPHEVRYSDEFGSYVGQVAPILGDDGRVLALVEASAQRDLLELYATHERNRVLLSLATAVTLAMLLALLVTVRIVQHPLRRLQEGVAEVRRGNFDHRIRLTTNDEFQQLAGAFNRMAAGLQDLYGGLEGLVEARTRRLEDANTALQRTLDELRAAHEMLLQSEKMAAVGQLVEGMAHEINNPLAGIMGFAQLCMERTDDPALRPSLEKISHEAERAGQIVRNLLTFSDQSPTDTDYVDVNEVLSRTLRLREYELRVSNVRVERDFAPAPLRTLGDFHELQKAFLNVINNAAAAIRGDRGRGTILCRTEKLGDRIGIEINDDGPGIPPEILPRIFDPFFTTREVGDGAGLGLSITYGIVRQHGGSIRAEDRPGGGASIRIELPVRLGAAPPGDAARRESHLPA